MTDPKRNLAVVVGFCAVAMAVAAGVSIANGASRETLTVVAGSEIVLAALIVLPFFTYHARRAASRFSPGDAAEPAWRALSTASIALILGQVCAYAPAVFDLGRTEPYIVMGGQLLPAVFRIVLWWALWRMRRAYRATGIDFTTRGIDYAVTAGVVVLAIVLIFRRNVLFDYWSADSDFTATTRAMTVGLQVFNFVLYPAVFSASLSMSRYAVQMGGGLVSRAWCGVAIYGLFQPLHAFSIALLWPMFGPLAAVTFDNFIVLAAFAALAVGPMYQVEATEVSRS